MMVRKINKKNKRMIEIVFENEKEYKDFLSLLKLNISFLQKNKEANTKSEEKLVSYFEKDKKIDENIIVNITEDLFFDLFFIMYNSMSIIKGLDKINKVQSDYIKILKDNERKDLQKLIEKNKKS